MSGTDLTFNGLRLRLQTMRKHFPRRAVAPLTALCGNRAPTTIGILLYHRVTEVPPARSRPTLNVTPSVFRQQLRDLATRGYRAWPLRKVLDYGQRGLVIPPKTFVVTFDDGYESVHRNAWPILRELGVPATVFLVTAFLDSKNAFPFDDWPAKGAPDVPVEAWRPLSSAQCREMAAEGLVELGAHTHTHGDFRSCPDALRIDLSPCVEIIRERFKVPSVTFAFPYGMRGQGFSGPAMALAARQTGVVCGLTSEAELVDPAGNPFEWGRFEVTQADSGATIAACLSGWYSLVRNAYHRLLRPTLPMGRPGTLR